MLIAIACDRRDDEAVEPSWLLPTTAISLDTVGSREDCVQIRIEPDGLSLRSQQDWVDTTLDDISQRLQAKKSGDVYDNGLIASRPSVAIQAAPETPWREVAPVLGLCETWYHRRVFLDIDHQTIGIYLPWNASREYPRIPGAALVPMTLHYNRTDGTSIVVKNRRSDLGSLRARIGEVSEHIRQRPAVALLDIDPEVPAGDVARFLRILINADIRRYIEKLPEPPPDR